MYHDRSSALIHKSFLEVQELTKNKIIITLIMFFVLLFLCDNTVYAEDELTEEDVKKITQEVGDIYNISPELLQAIAFNESSYNPTAENAGCKGIMQVSEKWHKNRMERLNVVDIYDPYSNILVAADYLSELFEKYKNEDIVLMFYSGNSRAEEYSKGIGEPSDYVNKVLELSSKLEREHRK